MQLSEIFKEYGIPNLMFRIPMERIQESGISGIGFISNDPDKTENVNVYINQSTHKVADNYKITLDAENSRFGKATFYISDLESLLRNNSDYSIFALDIDGYRKINFN